MCIKNGCIVVIVILTIRDGEEVCNVVNSFEIRFFLLFLLPDNMEELHVHFVVLDLADAGDVVDLELAAAQIDIEIGC